MCSSALIKQTNPWKKVLVTGATGVLGAFIVKRLLEFSAATIYCPARSKDNHEAEQRVKEGIAFYSSLTVDQINTEKLKAFSADLSSPELYAQLCSQSELQDIEVIFHCGALTNLFARPEPLTRINVEGTRQLAHFGLTSKVKLFCFVSSYAVFGDGLLRAGARFDENDLDVGQSFPRMYYHASKLAAEMVVRSPLFADLPWVICRAGNIFGDSQFGKILRRPETPSMLFYDALKTGTERHVAFKSNLPFDLTPVDYVADAVIGLTNEAQLKQTFHLLNPASISFEELAEELASLQYPMRVTSFEQFKQETLALKNSPENGVKLNYALKALRFMLIANPQLNLSEGAHIGTEHTVRTLRVLGYKPPPSARDLVKLYVKTGVADGYLNAPPSNE